MIEIKTTVKAKNEAQHIADALLNKRKALSVRLKKVHYRYRYRHQIRNTKGIELNILAPTANKADIINTIKKLSSGDPHEIIIHKVETTDTVINWCNTECKYN